VSRRLKILDFAWAAGFLDGEASFGTWTRSDGRKRTCIQVAQLRREPLDRLAATLGGRVYGPYERKNGNPYFMWTLQDFEGVQAAIASVWRFLSAPKQEQAAATLKKVAA
jgi:hypothetical protein